MFIYQYFLRVFLNYFQNSLVFIQFKMKNVFVPRFYFYFRDNFEGCQHKNHQHMKASAQNKYTMSHVINTQQNNQLNSATINKEYLLNQFKVSLFQLVFFI